MACRAAIEAYLDSLTSSLALPAQLVSAIRYALLGGGKRLRPILTWNCCTAVGGSGEAALPAAAAVELIHAFSLVHDDLPAMDDDDLRRGKPTLHIHAGEAMAILAGDAMMALAFEHLSRQVADSELSAAMVRELSAATTGMIAGQVYDTLGGFAPELEPRQRLELVHRNKTGALIRGACRLGALAGGVRGGDPQMAAVTAFGEHIGLIFQIVDDLLDVEATAEHSGKRTRKDAAAGKITYPSLIGIEASRREVNRLTDAAVEVLAALGPLAEPLRELALHMSTRSR
jgi:geranylgeranyl diphosphate synthase, type II